MSLAQIRITETIKESHKTILTEDALQFVGALHHQFNARRIQLLEDRKVVQQKIDQGEFPDFDPQTADIREGEWKVGRIPKDLEKRNVEITGPVSRKMVINALNSGADVFMADFEDANSPTWDNCIEGQVNLFDAIRRQIDFSIGDKHYQLNDHPAVLVVRPRGWHLVEKHVLINDEPVSASLFDFGLYFIHNAKALLSNGSGPYFYLPKLENRHEAELWNQVFVYAQKYLNLPVGTIKATVLLETILASFEIEEILYKLKDHIVAMNAGRWDYIFSIIKKFRIHKDFVMPDRSQVTMRVPFMKSYAELLVKLCHKRGAHAIGGMSAFLPANDEDINRIAIEKVAADKRNEASQGYDGTWVAHPFLVPVARAQFDSVLHGRPHQKNVLRDDVEASKDDLINVKIDGGQITEAGVRLNINVGILYIESWLQGIGAAALYNLMEDAATAEISRAQIWQWLRNDIRIDGTTPFTSGYYEKLLVQEKQKMQKLLGEERVATGKLDQAVAIFDTLVREDNFGDFLTLEAYNYL